MPIHTFTKFYLANNELHRRTYQIELDSDELNMSFHQSVSSDSKDWDEIILSVDFKGKRALFMNCLIILTHSRLHSSISDSTAINPKKSDLDELIYEFILN